MDDMREKVIKGLECCRRGFCSSCPYNDGVDENTQCKQRWADDALSMLKSQEPRVMTLEETEKSEIGFIEWRDEYITAALIIDVYADDTVGVVTPDEDGEYWVNTNEYGKTWRRWTARPTDEQREATPWPEPPKEG